MLTYLCRSPYIWPWRPFLWGSSQPLSGIGCSKTCRLLHISLLAGERGSFTMYDCKEFMWSLRGICVVLCGHWEGFVWCCEVLARCLRGVWEVFARCLRGVCEVFARCLRGVGMVIIYLRRTLTVALTHRASSHWYLAHLPPGALHMWTLILCRNTELDLVH